MNNPQVNTAATKVASAALRNPVPNKPNAGNNEAKLATQAKEPVYNGPEQRKEQRRLARDRRDSIRYELKKDSRRSDGRRATDNNPWLKYQG